MTIHSTKSVEGAVKIPSPCHPTTVQLPSDKKGQPQVLVVHSYRLTNTAQQSPIAQV